MKNPIGINSWVWTSPFTAESLELVARAAKMGFDLIEVGLEDPAHFPTERFRDALKEQGIKASFCGAFGPTRDLTHEDPRYREESLRYIADASAIAERCGVTRLVGPIYSAVGKRRQVPPDQKKREWDLAVQGLRAAAKVSADRGVVLAVEPLNRFETDLINTAEQVVRLVDEVAQPNVKVHLDTFHMTIEEESIERAIRHVGSRLAHFHACENNRGAPGSGLVDWKQVASALHAVDYRGPLVIESFTPDCLAIAAAAAIWRPLASSQDALASGGLAFLRQLTPADR